MRHHGHRTSGLRVGPTVPACGVVLGTACASALVNGLYETAS
jgi:hypothetical protein